MGRRRWPVLIIGVKCFCRGPIFTSCRQFVFFYANNLIMTKKRKSSETYFHAAPEMYNCAQSVLKGFQTEFSISDEKVEEFRAFGGGRAENGICGALYAANFLMEKMGKPKLDDAFKEKVSYVKCRDIKGNKACSCPSCVRIADELVSLKMEK